jgi:Kef-type K+ transport system membrane component KefB
VQLAVLTRLEGSSAAHQPETLHMNISLQVLFFLAMLILLAKAAGGLAARVGLPAVLGELLAGVVLGPTLLDVWKFPWFAVSGPVGGGAHVSLSAFINVLAEIGVVVLMFLAGMETDISAMKKAFGPAFWAACGGVVLPFAGSAAIAHELGFAWRGAIFIGTILTATSVSISAQTLMNLKQLRSKAGSTILAAAVIDDVLGLLVLSLVIAIATHVGSSAAGNSALVSFGWTVVRMVSFFLFAFLLGPRLIRWSFRAARHFKVEHTSIAAALAIGFLFAFLSQYGGGMAAITGSYLAGLFIAASPTDHAEVISELRSMTNSFFGPLFFASIGLEINAWALGGHFGFFFLILLMAILGKVFGCGLGAWFNGFSGRDGLIVGVGMVPRGEVGLITANIGWAAGIVSPDIYSLVIVLVLATTLVTPPLLGFCFEREPAVLDVPAGSAGLEGVSPES